MIGAATGRPAARGFAFGWHAVAAALALLSMLFSLQRVVRQAVSQGELRNRMTAQLADATWRCKALHEASLRSLCLAQLRAVPRDNADLQLPALALAASASAP